MSYAPARARRVFPTAARTVTVNSNPASNPGGATAARARISTTAVSGAPSTVFTLQGRKPDGTWEDLLSSAAVATVSETVLTVGQGLATTANVSANLPIPSAVRVRAVHGNANSHTYGATVEFFG